MKKLLLTLVACIVSLCANATTVYFQNTGNWGTVNAYCWNGGNNNSWPGEKVGSTISATNGITYYAYEVPSNYVSIIFNNGGDSGKTKDLTISDGAVFSYEKNSSTNGTIDPIGTITESNGVYTFKAAGAVELTQGHLYFPVSTYNTTNAYLYTWSPEVAGGWPGTQLTKETINNVEYWVFTIADNREITNVKFGGIQLNTGDNSNEKQYTGLDVTDGDIIAINAGVIGNDPYTSKPDVPEPDPDYMTWYVNFTGTYNDWSIDEGKQPNKEGIASADNLAIGDGLFQIKIWDGKDDLFWGLSGPFPADGEWHQLIENGSSFQVSKATSNCVYNAEYDVVNNQLRLTFVSGDELTEDEPKPMYLRGVMTLNEKGEDWSINPSYLCSVSTDENGQTVYTLSVASIGAGQEFKFGTEDWVINYSNGDKDLVANRTDSYTLTQGGTDNNMAFKDSWLNVTFTLTVDKDNANTAYLMITGTQDTDVMVITFGNDKTNQSGSIVDGVYTISRAENTGDALIYIYPPQNAGATALYYKVTPTAETSALALDGYTKAKESGDGGYIVPLPEGKGEFNVYYTDNNGTDSEPANYNYAVTIETPTGIDAIGGDAEEEAVYYNLQGVRVENPQHGIFVKVVGNKATKVVL